MKHPNLQPLYKINIHIPKQENFRVLIRCYLKKNGEAKVLERLKIILQSKYRVRFYKYKPWYKPSYAKFLKVDLMETFACIKV